MDNVTVQSKVGTQPGLSITNEELQQRFPELLAIPKGVAFGTCFIAAIGTAYVAKNGSTFVPVTMVQARNDLYETSKTEANLFFRGWEGIESIVRHTEQLPPERLKELNLEVGSEVPGAQLFVDYDSKKFYDKGDGTPQDPVLNPQSEMYLAVETKDGQKPLYRNTRIQFGENLHHTGLELRASAEEITEDEMTALLEAGDSAVVTF